MLGLGNLLTKGGVITKFPNDFSFNFDGSNDHLETASPINVSGDSSRTFSAWIRPDSLPSSGNAVDVIAYGNQSSGQYFEFGIFNDSGTIKAWVNLWGEDVRQAQTFTTGTWYHYAVVFTNSASGQGTIKLYINGSLIHTSGTLGQTNAINTGNTAVGIGYRTNNDLYFDGHIDEVAVWNTALDASTIAKLGSKPVDLTKYSASNLKLWLRAGDASEPESNTAIARQDFYSDFDGTDDYVNLGNASEFPDDPDGEEFTITAWVNCSVGSDGTIFSKADTSNRAIQLYTHTDDELFGKIGGTELDTNTVIADGTWHHVVLRSFNDGGTYKGEIYIDGVFKVVGTSGTTTATDRDFLIGARRASDNTDAGYLLTDSSVSNLSIYKTALDAQTIKQFAKSRFTPMRDNRFSVVDFDGTNDYIDCGSFSSSIFSDSYDDGLTLESWFKTDSVSAYQGIVEIGLVSGSHGTLQLMINPDADKAMLRVNGASESVSSSHSSIVANQWYHISGVFDGANNELKFYLNGVLSGTTSYSSALDFSTYGRQIDIGRMRNDLEFSGAISSVSIYNIARSESTIYSTYQKGITHNPSADTGLVGLWLMGDDISKAYPTIADSSSNSNDGTITNSSSNNVAQQMVAGYDLGAFESTEVLGNELIENGVISTSQFTLNDAYDASTGNGVTIDNGTLRIRTTGGLAQIYDADLLENGALYKIVVVVSDVTSGSFYFRGGSDYALNVASEVGTYIVYLQSSGTQFHVARNSGATDVSISSLSVKKVFQSDLSDTYPAILDVTEPVAGTEILNNFDFSAGTGSNATNWSAESTSVWVFDEDNDRYMWDQSSAGAGDYNIRQTGANMLIANGLDTGKVYQLTINVTTGSNSTVTMYVSGDNSGHKLLNPSQLVDGDNTFTVGYPVTGAGADNDAIEVYSDVSENSYDFWLNSVSLKEVQGNTGFMNNQASDDLVYSSVLPDQSFLVGNSSPYNFIDLDGSDEYIDCGTGIGNFLGDDYAGDFSASVWFNADVNDKGIFNAGTKFNNDHGEFSIVAGGNFIIYLNDAGYYKQFTAPSTGTWNHIAVSFDASSESNLKVFLNGSQVSYNGSGGSFPSAGDLDFNNTKTIIGAFYSSSFIFNGKIGQTAFYNKALSETELSAIYTLGRHGNLLDSYSDNLLGYWAMGALDASTGLSDVGNGTIYDRSGQSNHGTATNTESADLKSSPNAQPNGYAKGDTNRSTTTP